MAFLRDAIRRLRGLGGRLRVHVTRVEGVTWVLLAIAYVVVHASQIGSVFGEADGARMATDAAGWHYSGKVHLESTEYRMRTSPLYLQLLKLAMDCGLHLRGLPRVMAWMSLLASVVALTGAYFLFRQFIGKVGAAIAVGFMILAPAFWLAASYGMSHGPGLAMFIVALSTFSVALTGERTPRSFFGICALATLFVFMAIAFKADLVLNGLAFPGLVLAKRRLEWRTFVTSCAIVVIGLGLQMLYVKALVTPLPAAQSTTEFAQTFNQKFPFALANFSAGAACITHAFGPVTLLFGVAALVSALTSREGYRLAIFAVGWGLPIVLFWGFMLGNSARHNLSAVAPLSLLLARLALNASETPARAAVFAAFIAGFDYTWDQKGEGTGFGTVVPRTDVFAIMPGVIEGSESTHKWARGFSRLRADKKALVARWSTPFAVYEVLRLDENAKSVAYDGHEISVNRADGATVKTKMVYAVNPMQGMTAMRELRDGGYTVWRRDF
jgi:hypothetical protein